MLRRPSTAAAVIALCLLLPVTPALASGADVIVDCNDNGHLTKTYSQKEYRDALAQMPADIRQYTDCENVIRRAQLGLPNVQASSGDAFKGATPEEEARARGEISTARKTGGVRQRLGPAHGGFYVTPGALSFTKVSAATSSLPTPLRVLIALIVVAAIAAAVHFVLHRRREHPRDPRA